MLRGKLQPFTNRIACLRFGINLKGVKEEKPMMGFQVKTRRVTMLGLILLACCLSGCQSLLSPVSGVPSHRIPEEFLTKPKNNLVPIDISRLRQEPPNEYLVDADDILGIFIETILGEADQPPPVHMPEGDSDLPPAIGYPIPVRSDGTLALPLVEPIEVRGLTLRQVEKAIRAAYTVDKQFLPAGKDRIIVTLLRPREYHVIVIRQDGGIGDGETNLSSRGQVVKLPAYKNDVMNALAQTGGLPGVEAKNEVVILKGRLKDAQARDAFVLNFYNNPPQDPCLCFPPLPDDRSATRIPLRLPPGQVPQFNPEDVILESGDIVYIESREREVFYTGGLLGGGEFPLPRDYDLDVIGAMSIVGGGIASSQRGGGGGGGGGGGRVGGMGGGLIGGIGGVAPGQLFILRETPCNGQITIAVDLNRAIRDSRARPLIQPGDILVLQYKPQEEVLNFALGTFFTYGISDLLRGGR